MSKIYPVRIDSPVRVVYLEGIGYFKVPVGLTFSLSENNTYVAARGVNIPHVTWRINKLTATDWFDAICDASYYIATIRVAAACSVPNPVEISPKSRTGMPKGIYKTKSGTFMVFVTNRAFGVFCKTFPTIKDALDAREEVYKSIHKRATSELLNVFETLDELYQAEKEAV